MHTRKDSEGYRWCALGLGDWGSECASFRSSVEAVTTHRAQGLGGETMNYGRSAWGEERHRRGLTPFPAGGLRTFLVQHQHVTVHSSPCPLAHVRPPFLSTPTPSNSAITRPENTQKLIYTTHTHSLEASDHFSRNSARLPLSDWQETGRVRTTSCE